MEYTNTQRAPLGLILYAIGIGTMAVAFFVEDNPVSTVILVCAGLLVLGAGLAFGHLAVRDEGDSLLVRYGPLPMFSRSIPYADVTGAQRDRTNVFDGWGIHYAPWRGWTYNLWGFDCVKISLGERIVRVGTNDPENLTEFLKTKITRPDPP